MEYYALKVIQSPTSDPFYLISAKAEDIVEWADAPRKVVSFKVGFQRELNEDRVEDISNYLRRSKENILPGAILIAIDSDDIEFEEIQTNEIYKIKINEKKHLEDKELIEYYCNKYEGRLSELELEKVQNNTKLEENNDSKDNNIEDDTVIPESYLSDIVIALKKFDELDQVDQKNILKYLRVTYKQGIILDGQHRVFGAKNISETPIFLPVVLFPNMKESEQVFHFYVMNNKAVPINKTELRNVISTSLSDKEIDDLYDRFKAVGVHTTEARWTSKINSDETSPFKGLLSFAMRDDIGFIKENVMDNVIKKFMNPGRQYKVIFSDFTDWFDNNDQPINYKFDLFYIFWETISDLYSDTWADAILNKKGQIFMKASFLTLQEYYFESLLRLHTDRLKRKEPSPFKSLASFKESVKMQFGFIVEDFFKKEWIRKDMDTSTGRKEMKDILFMLDQNAGDLKSIKKYFK